MNVLVTAGNTQTPLDRVRAITNIFSGRTGTRIALEAHRRGHRVTLLTSQTGVVAELAVALPVLPGDDRWDIVPYRTYDDLDAAMAESITSGGFDAVVHCAAVSDYRPVGHFIPAPGTSLTAEHRWVAGSGEPTMLPADAGKVRSHHPELWLRLEPTAKLIDSVRSSWGFAGVLVKFKLEVGATEAELMAVAESSRRHSRADAIVANTLEGMHEFALIGDDAGRFVRIDRADLAGAVVDRLESLHAGR